jgi:putative transcription factor
MCGKDTLLFKTDIEGSIMKVCKACSKYGKVISMVREDVPERKKTATERILIEPKKKGEMVQTIVEDYGERVKKKREHLGLKQEELAKSIAEKESVIHHIESGKHEPNIDLARKLEHFLKITLVEEYQEPLPAQSGQKKSGELTIGDLIRVRKKD